MNSLTKAIPGAVAGQLQALQTAFGSDKAQFTTVVEQLPVWSVVTEGAMYNSKDAAVYLHCSFYSKAWEARCDVVTKFCTNSPTIV